MKIRHKILLATGLLVTVILLFQGALFQAMVKKELRKVATSNLDAAARSKSDLIVERIDSTRNEIIDLQSYHYSLDRLVQGSLKHDGEMIDEAVAQLQHFFDKFHAGRTRYTQMGIVLPDGKSLLAFESANSVEPKLEQTHFGQIMKALHTSQNGTRLNNNIVFHLISEKNEQFLMIFVPSLVNGKVVGMVWFCQPFSSFLKKTFNDMQDKGIAYLLIDEKGEIFSKTDNLTARRINGLTGMKLPEMVLASQKIPEIGLRLSVGMEKGRAFMMMNRLFMVSIIILLLALVISMATIGIIAHRISKPIVLLQSWAEKLSLGDLSHEAITTSDDEIGELNTSIVKVVNSFRDVSHICEAVSNGDLSKTLRIRSDKDILSHSVNKMMLALKEATARNASQNWVRNGVLELNNILQGEQEVVSLADRVVGYLGERLNMQMGIIYLADEKGEIFWFAAGFACVNPGDAHAAFRLGDGLVGEAAKSRKMVFVDSIPGEYARVRSGLGNAPPRQLLFAPLLHNGEVKGVIELGSFDPIDDMHKEFLEQVLENIAISLYSAQSRSWIKELLAKTRVQAEELSIQQVEMQQINEELEEQAQTLEKQKEELLEKNMEVENARRIIEEKARELEQSSKYKSEFLANMSHELRTPLNSLLILSNLLSENKNGNLTNKQVEYAETIHKSGNDLLTLINEVLDLSKIEAGRMEVVFDDINLDDYIKGLNKDFLHVAQNKNLSFVVERRDDLPDWIKTDRQRLDQIVRNFLSNAFKFTHQGGITVTLRRPERGTDLSRSGLAPDNAIAIDVADTGIGIPADKYEHVFEAFRQVDGSTSRNYGGTGLGLSISRDLAKIMGGEIDLSSVEGKGSIFTLYLPAAPNAATKADYADVSEEKPAVPAVKKGFSELSQEMELKIEDIRDDRRNVSQQDRVVLIIEDDAAFARILYDMAVERGFKALIANDGEAGLYLAEHYLPDAVILDVNLPRMDGFTVLEQLKASPKTRNIAVHMISGADRGKEAIKLGAIEFLSKPISMEELSEAFKRIQLNISVAEKQLLIVDDNEILTSSVRDLFNEENILASTAGSAAEALVLLKSKPFDCMIVDLGLPDMSGFDFMEMVRNDRDIPYLPIIVFTGRMLTEEEDLRLQRLAESVVIKGGMSPQRLLDETALFLHRVVDKLPAQKPLKDSMPCSSETVLKGKKILIADDDMRNVFALSSVAEGCGMKVEVAKNGREAIRCLENVPDVNIVLMDIMMPEMDGFEAIREIRKLERFKKLPIIAITAKAMRGDRSACIEAGASDYLAKPVEIDKLVSLMKVWLYK